MNAERRETREKFIGVAHRTLRADRREAERGRVAAIVGLRDANLVRAPFERHHVERRQAHTDSKAWRLCPNARGNL